MGYDISQATWEKLEANRRADRLCRGATRSRAGCAVRATAKVIELFWVHRINVGEARQTEMTMCRRHANQAPAGYEGTNFRVIEHQAI